MALTQRRASVDSLRLDHPIGGVPFPFVFGNRAILRRRTRPSENHSLSRRSLHSGVMSLVNLGAIEYRYRLRE